MEQESSHGSPNMERTNWVHRRKNSFFEDQLAANYEKRQMNKRKRVVKKGGGTGVTYKNISKKRRRYFSDLYTTLLDSSWSYCVLMFTASFYLSWLLFAVIYYIISTLHGDLEPIVPGTNSTPATPCILEVRDFSSCFLFSLETQHTIGYGTRQTTTECPSAVVLVSLQSVLGCLIQAFMVGLVFSKLSRPQLRQKTVIFSNHAVVTQRNKKLCLIFRIGDLRDDNFILGTQISAKILRRRTSAEGEVSQEMTSLTVSPDSSDESCIFFVWPLEIVHVIDKESPLYDVDATNLAKEKFELIVIMEGTIETSSMTFQARSSYLPNEILWGHRFESMVLYRKDHNKFQVNFSAFNSTYEVETPTCSARDLELHYLNQKQVQEKKFSLMMINNVTNHMPMLDVTHPFIPGSEEQDSSSQPPSVINNINSDLSHHPLLGEFRSNSMSGGRPSVVSKTNIGPSNSFGGGGALLYNNTSTRHNSHKVSNNSNRSSGGSGATPTEHTRERKTTYDSDDVSEREAEQEQAAAAAVTMPPSSTAAESGPEAANKTATSTSTFHMGSDKPPTSSWHMGSDKLVLGGSETA